MSNIEEKIESYLNEESIYDMQPTNKAVIAAKKVISKYKSGENLERAIKDCVNREDFVTSSGKHKFKRGILAYLVQSKIITKGQAEEIQI
jgi:hypothetical protein